MSQAVAAAVTTAVADDDGRSGRSWSDVSKFWDYLHKKHGRCGHCGKKKCPGKKSHSVLPDNLPTASIVEAVKQAAP